MEGETAINAPLTIKDAARHFKGRGIPNATNPTFLKGVAMTMGVTIHRVGKQDLISQRDFERLSKRVEEMRSLATVS
jgi:hypothetical protein